MGKRSDFERRKNDAYQTIDAKPARLLMPHLAGVRRFAEPCAGEGRLIGHLVARGLTCVYAADIQGGNDALSSSDYGNPDAIITNPPWTRALLYPLIRHFQAIAPTWLLLDADWAQNEEAGPYLETCSHIVAVGRVKWIENSKHSGGKDNSSWYRFDAEHRGGPLFVNQRHIKEAA